MATQPLEKPKGSDRNSDQMICALCREPITLETANTDDDGRAVHSRCYALKIASDGEDKAYPEAA